MKVAELVRILQTLPQDADACTIDPRTGICLEINNVYESKFVDGEDNVGQPVVNIC